MLGAVAAATALGDEPMRCGRWVVDSSVSVSELLKKCGEPTTKEVVEQDVRAIGPTGAMIKVGKTAIETWTYDRGTQAAAVRVRIKGGKIKSFERVQR